MFGVFFILIDLVIVFMINCGCFIFGVFVGLLVWLICSFGGYFDGVVFVVLLVNIMVFLIDYYMCLCVYGYCKG